MLKLERRSKKNEITIRLREKDPAATSAFLKAFLFAALWHVGALLCFHVALTKPKHPHNLFLPAIVSSDLFSKQKEVNKRALASQHPEFASLRKLLLPKVAVPHFFSSNNTSENKKREVFETETNALVFSPLENVFHRTDKSSPELPPKSLPTITVRISGPLAEKKVLADGTSAIEKNNTTAPTVRKERVVYSVQMNDKKGQIFWFSQEPPFIKSEGRDIAERVLSHMRFEKDPSGFITKGTMEITLALPYD